MLEIAILNADEICSCKNMHFILLLFFGLDVIFFARLADKGI